MTLFDKKKLKKIKEEENEKAEKRHTIMIVDDEEAHLSSMESLLSDQYYIITAHNGREAMEIIENMNQKKKISLIISDQRMPEVTGIELFEQLKETLPDTIRIILTGFIDIPVIIDAINKTQIYQFIQKPFEPEDLKLRVSCAVEAFEQRQQLDKYYRILEEKNKELKQKNKELEEANRRLEESNLLDPLTGLRNRRYIQKFIHSEISKMQRDYESCLKSQIKKVSPGNGLIFMILDIDNLKSVNRLYERKAGDIVLKHLTQILQKECHQPDILVRWGNDEFLVVSFLTDRNQVHLLTERLWQAVEKNRFELGDGQSKHLTCSIGFAAYPFLPKHPKVLDWEKIVSIAEQALNAAQNSGGNAWVGIKITEKTKIDKLYQSIRDNVTDFVKNSELTVLTSIPNKHAVVWKK